MECQCDIKGKDGTRCSKSATHEWGKIHFCCEHFDQFIHWLYAKRIARPLRDMDTFDAGQADQCLLDHPWDRDTAEGRNAEFEREHGRTPRDDKDKK